VTGLAVQNFSPMLYYSLTEEFLHFSVWNG